ncbi:hypothetical protein [Tolypothrix sp. VBCCA 56010]|uniref:hypothetical protein n=1 Tax=Tolypothrix sp. VBCCA 56010 TaxID=3137731 RepID=UPI003D7C8D40
MTPEQQIQQEIAENLVSIGEVLFSAQAWKFFQTLGRGYLYMHKVLRIEHTSGNNFSVVESESQTGNRMHYVAKGTQAWQMMKLSAAAVNQPILYAQYYALIDNYDPRKEYVIVVGFNYGSDAVEYFFLRRPEVPPQEAFKIVSDRPLEFGIESL